MKIKKIRIRKTKDQLEKRKERIAKRKLMNDALKSDASLWLQFQADSIRKHGIPY